MPSLLACHGRAWTYIYVLEFMFAAVATVAASVMHRALKSAKVDVEMVIYNTGGHGYGIHAKKDAPPWNIVLESWVERRKA